MPIFGEKWLRDNRLEPARYAFDGDVVFVPFHDGEKWILTPATVTCAAGNHVRVASKAHGFERWYDAYDIYRKRAKVEA